MPVARICATLIAFLLVVVLIPLVITSFRAIHAKIPAKTWKRIQLLAYPFYLLVFLHMLFYLAPPAIAGSLSAAISLSLYLALGIAYAVLRVRLYLQSRSVSLRPASALS
jgi:DMSO/TMAO reductase YedYZ heme-binding membrane subunit